MNLEKYRKERKRLFDKQPYNRESDNLMYASNSLGEVGELQNVVKKIYRDCDGYINEKHLAEMIHEGGDVLWYLFMFFEDILGVKIDDVFEANIIKLKERYKVE